MIVLNNAFSLNMLGDAESVDLRVRRLALVDARLLARDAVSVIGHEDVARLIGRELCREVGADRRDVVVGPGDTVLVGQYRGPRLPVGATGLPEDASLIFYRIDVHEGGQVDE